MIDIFHQKYLSLTCKKSNSKFLLGEFTKLFASIVLTLVANRPTFKTPRTQPSSKKMANYGYGWYTQEQLEDYYDQLIGRLFTTINIFRIILEINHPRRLRQNPEAGDLH